MAELRVARSELILGGRKSGKIARAELLAAAWLDSAPDRRAVYIATAQEWDEEMRARILQRQRRCAGAVPRMLVVDEPLELAHAIGRHSRADTLILVDCLTLWLTARMMSSVPGDASTGTTAPADTIANALRACAGPIVLIDNEMNPGNANGGDDARAFLEALGGVNQQASAACERVTLMSAGQAMLLKGAP